MDFASSRLKFARTELASSEQVASQVNASITWSYGTKMGRSPGRGDLADVCGGCRSPRSESTNGDSDSMLATARAIRGGIG